MKKQWSADLGLLFVAFIWGTTFVIVQDAVQSIPPLAFNGWRFLAAAIFLFIGWLIKPKKIYPSWKLIRDGVLLGLFLSIAYGTQTIALLYTSSSKTAFITGLSVVLVPLFAWFLLKQKPKTNALIGVVLATIGLYFLAMLSSLSVNLGDVLAFICALFFGLHIAMTAKVTNAHSSLLLTTTQLITVSVLSFLSGLFLNGPSLTFSIEPLAHSNVLFACLFTALFATAIAYFMQTSLQRFTSPTHVGIIFIMEPVFAAITAAIFQDQMMTLTAKIGAIFILGGMLLAEWPKKNRKPALATPLHNEKID